MKKVIVAMMFILCLSAALGCSKAKNTVDGSAANNVFTEDFCNHVDRISIVGIGEITGEDVNLVMNYFSGLELSATEKIVATTNDKGELLYGGFGGIDFYTDDGKKVTFMENAKLLTRYYDGEPGESYEVTNVNDINQDLIAICPKSR